MKQTFIERADGEMTQVDFWKLYQDTFLAYKEEVPLLGASEVIKAVSSVFPNAQAMVIPGPPQRFIMRGVDRRREERHFCLWERNQCPVVPFGTRADLVEHVRHHVIERVEDELPCLWASCPHPPMPRAALWPHVITHLQASLPPDTMYLQTNPVTMLPQETPVNTVSITRAKNDPSPVSLTALLCIRLLFHLSFSSAGAAPKIDADHFGFPGVIEEDEEGDLAAVTVVGEEEGERRGRQAFIGVRRLMERVQINDIALMGWITEMVEVGMYTNPT
jgi:chromatin structure-remodeling complex subunit RSC9